MSAMPVTQAWQKCRTAEFTVHYGPSTCVITVQGELDAANADQLTAYVRCCAPSRQRLVLDLRGLNFIATAGLSSLHRINVVCSAAGKQWAMVPSRAVSRLLQICDPDAALPVTDSVGDAAALNAFTSAGPGAVLAI